MATGKFGRGLLKPEPRIAKTDFYLARQNAFEVWARDDRAYVRVAVGYASAKLIKERSSRSVTSNVARLAEFIVAVEISLGRLLQPASKLAWITPMWHWTPCGGRHDMTIFV